MPHCTRISALAGMVAVAGVAGGVAAEPPRIINIGVVQGTNSSTALAVTPDGAAVVGESEHLAFRWTSATGLEEIGPIQGTRYTRMHAITDDGETVIGYGQVAGTQHPCARAVRWTKAGLEDLNAALGVNGGFLPGAVTGDGAVIVGGTHTCVLGGSQAVRWSAATGIQQLGTVPGAHAPAAKVVSADGAVVAGGGGALSEHNNDAWRWTEATGMHLLGRLPGQVSACMAQAMSRDGTIIGGECYGVANQAWVVRAFIWTDKGGMEEQIGRPGWQGATVYGINGDGSLVVGKIAPDSQQWFQWFENHIAVAWIDGTLVDLNQWLPTRGIDLSGWVLEEARAVNPAGDVIVGTGLYKGERRAYVAYLGCYANCDGSTVEPVLNVDDFTCFINEFTAGSALTHEEQVVHRANCDGSTIAPVLNVDDFTCFINEFAAGCE